MEKLIKFLITVEAFKLKAYKCSAGRWTIGIGNTFYADGRPVKPGDVITKEQGLKLAEIVTLFFVGEVKKGLKVELNENQFTALVSFCYNVGHGAFHKSTLLKMINTDPKDPAIYKFWMNTHIKVGANLRHEGLLNRRAIEAKKYFSK